MRGVYLRALRSFYSWAVDRGHVERNPVGQLNPKNRKYGAAPSLDEEQLTRLVIAAAWYEPRRAWAILLMYATGARIDSLCHVRPEDVEGERIHFRVAKYARPYSVPLGRVGREATKELLAWEPTDRRTGGRSGTLLRAGEERVRQWLALAQAMSGVKAHPHLLRHTYATRLARVTDPGTWAELMNHSDLSQYRRYVGVDEKRLREAVEQL
jgi:integrase/recombinase XerC